MTTALALPSTFQKIAAMFAVVFAFLIVYAAMPTTAHALTPCAQGVNCPTQSGLTETQISAILSLLQSFGADKNTLNNVEAAMRGGRPTPPTPIPSPVQAIKAAFVSASAIKILDPTATAEGLAEFKIIFDVTALDNVIYLDRSATYDADSNGTNPNGDGFLWAPTSDSNIGITIAVSVSASNVEVNDTRDHYKIGVGQTRRFTYTSVASIPVGKNGKLAMRLTGINWTEKTNATLGSMGISENWYNQNMEDFKTETLIFKGQAGPYITIDSTRYNIEDGQSLRISGTSGNITGELLLTLYDKNGTQVYTSRLPAPYNSSNWGFSIPAQKLGTYQAKIVNSIDSTLRVGAEITVFTKIFNPTVCGTGINTANAYPDEGFGYLVHAVAAGGDTPEAGTQSAFTLYENDKPLGPAHTLHTDIRTKGMGRYSHWYNNLFFSASDNTDPRTNGRTYTYGGVACPNPPTSQASAGQGSLVLGAQFSAQSGVSEAQIQSILQQLQASGANQSLINQIMGVLRGQSGQPSAWSTQNNSNINGEFRGNNTPAGWQNRQVVFEARPNSGKAPLTVTFTSAVTWEKTSGASYYVNFGDGSTANALNCAFSSRNSVRNLECTAPGRTPGTRSVKHTYTTPGTYTAVLSKVVLCTAPAGAACAQAAAEVVASTTITVASSTSPWNNDNDNDQNPRLKAQALWFGRSGDDVREVQACLAKDKEIYPAGIISGYYGPLTEEAVKKFQSKHGIVSSGNRASTGWGMVGPATRALMKGQCGPIAGSFFLAAPSTGILPLKVKFTSNVGTKIEFGDGASEQFSYCQATTCAQEGFSVEHTYPFAGTYTARALKVEGSGTSTIERAVGSAVIKVASTTPWGQGPASYFPNQNN